MSKFKDMAQGFLSSMAPQPNPFAEQTIGLLGDLDPAAKAQVLAQLAVAEEINQLRGAVKALDSTISLKS
ncbi:hypothetical protein ACVWYS_002818 [Arthrobacter sp. TE12231]